MLGVFGSDSDEDRSSNLNKKTFHNKGVSFQRAGHLSSEEEEANVRPSFGRSSDTRAPESGDRPILGLSQKREQASDASEVVPKRSAPVFGVFQDSQKPFIPSSNPARSTQTPYKEDGYSKSQYRPPQHKKISRPGTEDASAKLMKGKAAQMMAKMGYRPGEGLGTSGKGIVNPIEAKLRPGQKAGLGSVDERTGQEPEDEHRKSSQQLPRKTESKQFHTDAMRKQKIRYKTSKEIAVEAGGGLKIPAGLESILDMTGDVPRMIKSLDDVQSTEVSTHANERYRISQSARSEVERLAAEWRELQDKKLYLAAEHQRAQAESDVSISIAMSTEKLIEQVSAIELSCAETFDEETKLNRLTDGLEIVQAEFNEEIKALQLDELAVSLLGSHLKGAMASWHVLSDPKAFVGHLHRLGQILRISELQPGDLSMEPRRQALHFETFMSTMWFPRIRSSLGTTWDASQSGAVLDLLDAWSTLIPPFLYNQVLEQLIMPRLFSSIREWNPRRSRNKETLSFLFQWLPLLGEKVPDLLTAIKRKFVIVLDQWKPKDGIISDLHEWRELLGPKEMDVMLERTVLPKLADLLRHTFVVEPKDQKLTALEKVMLWRRSFTPTTFGQLLETEFFPKWLQVLYLWLTGDPNFEEISLWYEWWREVIPEDLHLVPAVKKGFSKALEMMDYALDHGTDSLPAPLVGPARPIHQPAQVQGRKTSTKHSLREAATEEEREIDFKDVVEDWCAQQNCLLLPLRKAHESGNSLFKITASASGAGGVTVYFRGDIVMMQGRQKGSFVPVSLQEVAAALV